MRLRDLLGPVTRVKEKEKNLHVGDGAHEEEQPEKPDHRSERRKAELHLQYRGTSLIRNRVLTHTDWVREPVTPKP